MSSNPPGTAARTCPGTSEYGHGLSRTVVHTGGCCERWIAALNGPPGDFARYCGETDPGVLALLDAEGDTDE
jgi:hypothetical protein